MLTRRRRAALATALTAFAAVASASPASALTISDVEGTSLGDGSYSGVAQCPGDMRVVSGGFSGDEGTAAVVSKASGKHAWKVRAFETNSLRVTAYCSGKLEPTTESKQGAMPSQQGGAKAKCPTGSEVVSGGWQYMNQDPNSPVYKSMFKGERSWKVYGASSSQDNKITAYAYCLKNKDVKHRPGVAKPIASGSPRRGGSAGGAMAAASCHDGEELLGGGFTTTPNPDFDNNVGPDTFFGKSLQVTTRYWKIAAINYSNLPGKIAAVATCLP